MSMALGPYSFSLICIAVGLVYRLKLMYLMLGRFLTVCWWENAFHRAIDPAAVAHCSDQRPHMDYSKELYGVGYNQRWRCCSFPLFVHHSQLPHFSHRSFRRGWDCPINHQGELFCSFAVSQLDCHFDEREFPVVDYGKWNKSISSKRLNPICQTNNAIVFTMCMLSHLTNGYMQIQQQQEHLQFAPLSRRVFWTVQPFQWSHPNPRC